MEGYAIAFDEALEIFVGQQGDFVATVEESEGQRHEGLDIAARAYRDDAIVHLGKFRAIKISFLQTQDPL